MREMRVASKIHKGLGVVSRRRKEKWRANRRDAIMVDQLTAHPRRIRLFGNVDVLQVPTEERRKKFESITPVGHQHSNFPERLNANGTDCIASSSQSAPDCGPCGRRL